MLTIAVSILNYQASSATIACVQSLLAAETNDENEYRLQIYVADNASNADDQQRLREGLAGMRHVHRYSHDANLGFAAGHNQNLAKILGNSTPDFIWLLNNDCLVDPQSIRELLTCASNHPEVGIWGGTLLESDGETIQCAGGCFYSSWVSSYRQHGRGIMLARQNQLDSADYDYIAGASMFMPASTLVSGLGPPEPPYNTQKHPWLNEEFFLFFEVFFLTTRLPPRSTPFPYTTLFRSAPCLFPGIGYGRRLASAQR